jgi:hypothetical protein
MTSTGSAPSILGLAMIMAIGLWPCKALPHCTRDFPAQTQGWVGADPEIDKSPVWALIYGRYLYLLGCEMFWPNIDRLDRFRIAVVNWPDLAEDLGDRLDGRSIAGLPVDIIPFDAPGFGSEKGDFTMVFVGGSLDPKREKPLAEGLSRWMKKSARTALVITDGAALAGHDLAFKRMKDGTGLSLCLQPDDLSLSAKTLELPPHFLQKLCP